MTVAGTNDRDTVTRADDTNYSGFLRGPRTDFNVMSPNLLALKPDIAAPGENIVSSQTGTASSFFSQSGTSMATPNVAGAAAAVIEARPTIDPGSLKDLLKRNADTSQNTAAFPAVDATWDNDLGAGMLDVWAALAASTTDVKFPNCVGPPGAPGQPCALTPPMPSWNNTADISTASGPQVGVANTITAQVRNDGGTVATVLVNFGVYVFAVGNNQFFHIGTQQVTIPATTTVSVNQPWTPAAANHQCVQVSIDFGLDSDHENNVTQRNLQVAPSVFDVRVENPFMVPAKFHIEAKSHRDDWACRVSEREFELRPFLDCPKTIQVVFDAPEKAEPGEAADCDVAVWATPEDVDEPQLIGGVTVRTFVPKECRMIGQVIGYRGAPLAGVRLSFFRHRLERETDPQLKPGGRPPSGEPVATATTDEDGVFMVRLQHSLPYELSIEHKSFGTHRLVVRPPCDVGALRIVVTKDGVELAENHKGRIKYKHGGG